MYVLRTYAFVGGIQHGQQARFCETVQVELHKKAMCVPTEYTYLTVCGRELGMCKLPLRRDVEIVCLRSTGASGV